MWSSSKNLQPGQRYKISWTNCDPGTGAWFGIIERTRLAASQATTAQEIRKLARTSVSITTADGNSMQWMYANVNVGTQYTVVVFPDPQNQHKQANPEWILTVVGMFKTQSFERNWFCVFDCSITMRN